MKRLCFVTLLLGCSLVFSGCLKTNIVADQSPSTQEAELAWAHGFVYGLVPPVNSPLNAEVVCGDAGVAEVEFQQTFIQGLASGATWSLYTPQKITARCASGGSMSSTSAPSMNITQDSNAEAVSSEEASPTHSAGEK